MAEQIEAVISDFGGVLTTPLVQSFMAFQDKTGISAENLGKAMLDWLKTEARRLGCTRLQLDSGTFRKDAHAFYLREGLRIEAFHFGIALG